ncbi:MAG: hypothetical protein U0531_11870 [Dehalococcoidia bacterium]
MDRTLMSAIIKEKKDYFIGLYDAQGRMIDAQISSSAVPACPAR